MDKSKQQAKYVQKQHNLISSYGDLLDFQLIGVPAPLAPHFTVDGHDSRVLCFTSEFGRSFPLPRVPTFPGIDGVLNSKNLELIIDTNLLPNHCVTVNIWENLAFPIILGPPILTRAVVSYQQQIEVRHKIINDVVWVIINNINIPANQLTGRIHLIGRQSG
jgi:hypothetical protein